MKEQSEWAVEDWRTFGLRMSDACDELTKTVERLQQQRAEQMLRIAQLKAVTALAFSHLVSVLDDEECRFDHEGYCQTHSVSKPCEVAAAREFLRTHTLMTLTPAELKVWREARHVTQPMLAEWLGVHEMTVSRWERGERSIPPFLQLALRWLSEHGPDAA